MKLDNVDRKLLNLVQTDFPIVAQPYKVLAEKLDISEEEILTRLKNLMENDIIRRLGGIFDSRKLGYKGTLCALKVPKGKIDFVAKIVNSYLGITHNYLRDDDYNMWFTVLADDQAKVEKILNTIKAKTGITEVLNLPAEKYFKVQVNFRVNEV